MQLIPAHLSVASHAYDTSGSKARINVSFHFMGWTNLACKRGARLLFSCYCPIMVNMLERTAAFLRAALYGAIYCTFNRNNMTLLLLLTWILYRVVQKTCSFSRLKVPATVHGTVAVSNAVCFSTLVGQSRRSSQ